MQGYGTINNQKDMKIIILCGGLGERFKHGYYPKPLNLVNGKHLIYWVLYSILASIKNKSKICISFVYNARLKQYEFEQIVEKILHDPNIGGDTIAKPKFYPLVSNTRGAAETLYLGLLEMEKCFSTSSKFPTANSSPVLVLDNDNFYGLDDDVLDTISRLKGPFLFANKWENRSFTHYCFMTHEVPENLLQDIAEKRQISETIGVGGYGFTSMKEALRITKETIDNYDGKNELYLSACFRLLLDREKDEGEAHKVQLIFLPNQFCLGTEQECLENNHKLPKFLRATIVIDLDQTLRRLNAEPIKRWVGFIRKRYSEGHKIIVHTSRGMLSLAGKMEFIESAVRPVVERELARLKIPYHELIMGKPYGDLYIDDKSISSIDPNAENIMGFFSRSLIDASVLESKSGASPSPPPLPSAHSITETKTNDVSHNGMKDNDNESNWSDVLKESYPDVKNNNALTKIEIRDNVLFKRSANLNGEIHFYKLLHDHKTTNPKLYSMFPRWSPFFSPEMDKGNGSDRLFSSLNTNLVSIEYLKGSIPFSHLYSNGLLNGYLFNKLLDQVQFLHQCTEDDGVEIGWFTVLHAHYFDKMESRKERISERMSSCCKAADIMKIVRKPHDHDDTYARIWKFMQDEFLHWLWSAERTDSKNIIHGDCWFSNILLHKHNIYFIDMRGKFGDKLTWKGDSVYDYGKIYQSILGLDLIINTDPGKLISANTTALGHEDGTLEVWYEQFKNKCLFDTGIEDIFWERVPKHIPEHIIFGLTAYLIYNAIYFLPEQFSDIGLMKVWILIEHCIGLARKRELK